ncbi:MAG: hypothetical protein JWM19_847 [Actinomycetia bacterium]|nr:hypothetical protein [Actinomycetes bacterium]
MLADGFQVARLRYSGKAIVVVRSVRPRGPGKPGAGRAGRIFPAGYLSGSLNDGGLYDAWTARHPDAHTPSDRVVARGLSLEEAISALLDAPPQTALDAMRRPDGQVPFYQGDLRRAGWSFESGGQLLAAADIVGQVVNIGTKDGLVYDSARVTALDERRGVLTVEGGQHAGLAGDPRPTGTAEVMVYDIARGYVHGVASLQVFLLSWRCKRTSRETEHTE